MSSRRSRRRLLHAIGSVTAFSLSGCVSFDSRERTRANRTVRRSTATETATTTPPPPGDAFSVSASVVARGTDDAPPEIRYRLRNDADRSLAVWFGSALFLSDHSGGLARADSLALDPESYGGYGGPDTPREGC